MYSGHTTRTVSTVNESSRQGKKITTIVLHHMASTNFEGTLAMWTSATRVGSANYAVSNEGEVVGVVPEALRAWSLGSSSDGGKGAAFDRHSITFEIENAALGGGWPVSSAAQEATAQVVADICRRYDIACNRTQILGHREVYTRYHASYATACPGGLNMDWIVQRAAQLLGQGGQPAPIASTGSVQADPEGGRNISTMSTVDVQKLVGAAPDGIYGPDTTAKVKAWQAAHGLDADGIFGPLSQAAATGKLIVDGAYGPATCRAEQAALHVSVDGIRGPQTITAEQRRTGASVDGIDGPDTNRHLQQYLLNRGFSVGPSGVDGIRGHDTVVALQQALNAGKF